MDYTDYYKLTCSEIQKLYRENKASPEQVVDSYLKRIEAVDGKLNAFVKLNRESIDKQLKDLKEKKEKPLYGIPVVIKDNICVRDEETTCASAILKGFKPPYDAAVIERLREAGAILLGKANMDEFAFGSSCETSCYGPTKNPWDLDRIPGGSSGGSAAAVSADEACLGLGSDTGGSIRQPAALCGVVGLKPTYGRVSRYGLIAFASSLDQIGPITKDVRDAALLLNVIGGHDPRDSTSVNAPKPDYTKSLINDIKGLKVAVPKEYFVGGIDKEVSLYIGEAIKTLGSLGAKIGEVSLPHTDYAVSAYYIIAPAEASSNLARFDGVQYGLRSKAAKDSLLEMYNRTRAEGFGSEAKRRVILGTYVLSSGYYDAYYLKALKVRTKIKEDLEAVFKEYDCIVTPTSPTPAFKIGEKKEDPLSMYLSDIFTIPVNLAGIPAISVPCGFTKNGLPVGLQILGKPFDEETLFKAAYAYEQNTEWHKRRPSL
ncbi:MAG: Asp-tRNA(Asn)/Glu-tRNA(Gln) amidotransferase subunit GatA [Candidatus Omnitrophica bacterium]|nr:Asp-tRNA(Asn)/Glu-tRNA(Gln) amidotransferase subunit GatA [Candidatus Omnitrophota bacterium]